MVTAGRLPKAGRISRFKKKAEVVSLHIHPAAKACMLLALLCLSALPSLGQTEKPDWLLFSQGQALAARHEYGEALSKYREALAENATFPEVEVAIGDVYRLEGELSLALKQYQKAYDLRRYFSISDSKYEVLYRLSDLYEERQQYNLMEESLLLVSTDDARFNPPKSSRLKDQVLANFFKADLTAVLKLYRFDTTFACLAHSKLGWFYYKTGRFDPAIEHLLYAVIINASQAIQALAGRDPEYQFDGVSQLLTDAAGRPDLTRYLQTSTIFSDMYYLAGALFQEGKPTHAQAIWRLLAASAISGKYQELSRRQIRSPWMEPYLVVPSKPLQDKE